MRIIFLTAFAVLMSITVRSQIIPLDQTVRTGKLPNGFTYFIRHNETPKNRVIFYLANKVGSLLEADDQRGMAHFLEHMSFNGTEHFPKNELVNYLQKAGVSFGADINAYTGFEETVYQLPIPSDNPTIVKNAIEIMRDWAHGAMLEVDEINKERGVILEEMRLGKGANDRMMTKYFPLILNNSRHSNRIPIGTEEVLRNFKPEALQRYYKDWYRPNLQALIVVGDIDVDKMEQLIKVKFADLKNPVKEKPRTKYTVPLTGKNQFITVTDPEMASTTIQVVIKQPELPLHTIAQYQESIVRQLFNVMLSGRYNELSRLPYPPYLSGSADLNNFMGGLGAYAISVTAKPGELEKGFKAVWRENERIKRFGFTATELERAKTGYYNQIETAQKEKNKTPSESYVKEYLQYFLQGTAAPGVDYEFNLVKKSLADITLDELNKLLKTVIKTTDRDILLMAPENEKTGLPGEGVVLGWMKEVEAENVTAFTDETSGETLLQKEPVPGKVIGKQRDEKSGITTMVMSNGIKILLKPTDFKNNEISFSGFAPGGTSLYSDADYQSASAANTITSFGVGNYNTTALGKYLSGKRMGVELSINERTQSISGGAVNSDLEAMLQLMYGYVTEPRKDSLMFQGMMARSRAGLANRLNDPNSVFEDTISAVLGNNSVRRTGPSIEKINQINLDRAYSIYKERFASARGFTFVFVGSIDTTTIMPLLEKYIGGLPAAGKVEEAKDLNINVPAGKIEKIVYKGAESKATVKLVFSGAFDYSFDSTMKMDALKEVLQIRLLERLREDEGGVYTPTVSLGTNKLPQGRFGMTISFGCAPENVDKLIASSLDEIEKLKTPGPAQVNVDKVKAEAQLSIETAVKTNGFWLGYLISQLQNKEDLTQVDTYARQLSAITSADVKDVARKYLTGENVIKLILMPERAKVN